MQKVKSQAMGVIYGDGPDYPMVWIVQHLHAEFPWEELRRELCVSGDDAEDILLKIDDLSEDDIAYLTALNDKY